MKPVILITSSLVGDKVSVSSSYVNAVLAAGGVPLVAPCLERGEDIEALAELADGFLFSGGEDVHPRYFNEEVLVDNMTIVPERDSFEMKLAGLVLAGHKPALGICRGMQLLNIAAGGSIYQDIGKQYSTDIKHSNPELSRGETVHGVSINHGSRLFEIYKAGSRRVNSFHHQAVKEVSRLFLASAHSEDGLVEAVEMKSDRFIVGLQWHPEALYADCPGELELFKSFIKSAAEGKKS